MGWGGWGGLGGGRGSRVNSSAVLPQPGLLPVLFLSGLHNSQCSVETDPEGGL